jgi:hypothetical protein
MGRTVPNTTKISGNYAPVGIRTAHLADIQEHGVKAIIWRPAGAVTWVYS